MNSNKDKIVWAVFIYIDFKARDYYCMLTIVSFVSFMYPKKFYETFSISVLSWERAHFEQYNFPLLVNWGFKSTI